MKQNTQMTQLGKMFVYIALMQLRASTNNKYSNVKVEELGNASKLVVKLVDYGVVKPTMDGKVVLTKKGGELIIRYLKACSDELTNAHFGKMKWDKRSKFHKALMERIA